MNKVEVFGIISLINFVLCSTLIGYWLYADHDILLMPIGFTLSMFIAFFMWCFFAWDNQKNKEKEKWEGEHP